MPELALTITSAFWPMRPMRPADMKPSLQPSLLTRPIRYQLQVIRLDCWASDWLAWPSLGTAVVNSRHPASNKKRYQGEWRQIRCHSQSPVTHMTRRWTSRHLVRSAGFSGRDPYDSLLEGRRARARRPWGVDGSARYLAAAAKG